MGSDSPAAVIVDAVTEDTASVRADGKLEVAAEYVAGGDAQPVKILDADGTNLATVSGGGALSVGVDAWPDNPGRLVSGFFEQSGGTDPSDLRVDGSSTPVLFEYVVGAYDEYLNRISFVMTDSSVTFDGAHFGHLSTLANGLEMSFDDGAPTVIGLFRVNEDFVHFVSPGGFDIKPMAKDIMYAVTVTGGSLKLTGGTGEKLVLKVQDDLSRGLDYFKCSIFGHRNS